MGVGLYKYVELRCLEKGLSFVGLTRTGGLAGGPRDCGGVIADKTAHSLLVRFGNAAPVIGRMVGTA